MAVDSTYNNYREAREEEDNLCEGERKPNPEKPEPRLETRNNLPNLQSNWRRTLSKPGVANMAKGRITETQAAMKAATR
ncbi:hypothetical protein YC2023_081174 [Brassica napus]